MDFLCSTVICNEASTSFSQQGSRIWLIGQFVHFIIYGTKTEKRKRQVQFVKRCNMCRKKQRFHNYLEKAIPLTRSQVHLH